MTQEEHFIVYGRNIEIHHIDYDRKNCGEDNLITLCKQCNLRANYNRDYWKNSYEEKTNKNPNARVKSRKKKKVRPKKMGK